MLTIEASKNNSYDLIKAKTSAQISKETLDEVSTFHESLGNTKTPLIQLSGLADDLGVKSVFVKDESHRLGLNAFKGLGASYAMHKQLEKNANIAVQNTSIFAFFSNCLCIAYEAPSPLNAFKPKRWLSSFTKTDFTPKSSANPESWIKGVFVLPRDS
jgi:hypothetical protein